MSETDDRLAALEIELAHQRDHLAIHQLIASYGPLVDSASDMAGAQRVALLWIEDGIYDIGGVGVCVGRAAIAEVYAAGHFAQVRKGICHVLGMPHVALAGDAAVAINQSCVFQYDDAGGFQPWRISANRWDLVRRSDGWRIGRRINRPMNGDPAALALLRTF